MKPTNTYYLGGGRTDVNTLFDGTYDASAYSWYIYNYFG
jgi:hypothetical protein